jgi:hypothetical protein
MEKLGVLTNQAINPCIVNTPDIVGLENVLVGYAF